MVEPMLATITGYDIGLFVHITAVVLTFGPTFAFPVFVQIAETTAPRTVPTVLRAIGTVERFFVSPGLLVILLAGIYMLVDGSISVGESWVGLGIAAIVFLFGMDHGFFRPKIAEAMELAERDLAAADELSADYQALSRRIATAGKISSAIVLVTIFFMVVKP
jgi:uncharacterized membrane protein